MAALVAPDLPGRVDIEPIQPGHDGVGALLVVGRPRLLAPRLGDAIVIVARSEAWPDSKPARLAERRGTLPLGRRTAGVGLVDHAGRDQDAGQYRETDE